jgi:hypothetical protein
LLIAVFAFTAITVAFAVAERSQIRSGSLERWTPRKVSVARDPDRISRSESLGDLVGDLIFILWWLGVLRLPSIPEVRFTLTPVWDNLYWPILLAALAWMAMAAVNTFRPRWTRLRSAIRLGLDTAGLVLVGYLLTAGRWIDVAVPNSGGRELAVSELAKWVNLSAGITLGVIGVMLSLSIIWGIRRLRRLEATLVNAYP